MTGPTTTGPDEAVSEVARAKPRPHRLKPVQNPLKGCRRAGRYT
ncbi:hypothetical protein I551_1256 [Mycobacterium ulcerans str. Harvey]|uniref:Uncharacterized protein n=1 Tax=Mycobacterium ulcerans str. Harvey TaxID=1299332 RepID=A0ABP3AQL0_MYCUL|nr:hypothetical protein I551_1256 [Mycobacterium ulcerans str. Harvey]